MASRKKTDEPEIVPAESETAQDENRPDTSGVDLNDLLSSMDGGDGEPADTEEPITEEGATPIPAEEPLPEKPKRTARKKKSEPEVIPAGQSDTAPQLAKKPARKRTAPPPSVLTIESRAEVESQENIEETAWHEIRNAYRTRKILTGTLGGIEQTETGKTIAIVSYNDFRIVIPMKEMMINISRNPSGSEYDDLMLRQNKILGNMLGAEIDFVVKGIESKSRSVVANRKDAMLKKRQLFYMNTDSSGMYRIYDGRIVQARVIAVAEKVVRVEAFGVECSIMARDLSWDWLGDAHERFSVGDQILVRMQLLTSDASYTRELEAMVREGLAEKVPLSTKAYKISNIRLTFSQTGGRIEYVFLCDAEFYISMFGNRYPAIRRQIRLTGHHNGKF